MSERFKEKKKEIIAFIAGSFFGTIVVTITVLLGGAC